MNIRKSTSDDIEAAVRHVDGKKTLGFFKHKDTVRHSEFLSTVYGNDGSLKVVGGVRAFSAMRYDGYVWIVVFDNASREALGIGREYLEFVNTQYVNLYATIFKSSDTAMRFALRVGFQLDKDATSLYPDSRYYVMRYVGGRQR